MGFVARTGSAARASVWIAALAFGLAAPGASGAEEQEPAAAAVRFELCGNMDSVEVGEFGGPKPFAVLIQLEREAGDAFARLTAGSVGRDLEITHGGHVVLRARVQGEIRSGLVTAAYGAREDAERAAETLEDPSVCARQRLDAPQSGE